MICYLKLHAFMHTAFELTKIFYIRYSLFFGSFNRSIFSFRMFGFLYCLFCPLCKKIRHILITYIVNKMCRLLSVLFDNNYITDRKRMTCKVIGTVDIEFCKDSF